MRLRTRVLVMALVGVVALAVAGLFTASRFSEASDAGQKAVAQLEPAASSSTQLLVALGDMQRGVRSYVLTGKALSLSSYAEGAAQSAEAIQDMDQQLANTSPELEQQVHDVAAGRQDWIDNIAQPVISQVRSGHVDQAETTLMSDESVQSYELLRSRALALDTAINDLLSHEFTITAAFAGQLAWTLIVTWAVLFIGLFAAVYLIGSWVLNPLDQLRRQLREVARRGRHEMPIIPSGPPDLRDAAGDAESMRRQLVSEIDDARMAREGLEQEGPVVSAIRAELTRPSKVYAPGLKIYGDLQPAEGVLAGDWWDAVSLPDGRTAVIVTDVSGHGPEAGIVGLRLKLTITGILESGGSAQDAIERGARLFTDDDPARFATCVIVVFDPANGSIEWVNAGHLPPLVLDPQGTYQELAVSGPLLSTLGGAWKPRTLQVTPEQFVVLWTDGITESKDEQGEQLEVEGLIALTVDAFKRDDEPEQLVQSVLIDARSRSVDWRRDDVTLIIGTFATTPAG